VVLSWRHDDRDFNDLTARLGVAPVAVGINDLTTRRLDVFFGEAQKITE